MGRHGEKRQLLSGGISPHVIVGSHLLPAPVLSAVECLGGAGARGTALPSRNL